MPKFEKKNGARIAAAAGLGLTLALGAAPVVALAEGTNAPSVSQENVHVVNISTAKDLAEAIEHQTKYDAQVWNLQSGVTYNLDEDCLKVYGYLGQSTAGQTGWYFPIFSDNVTINGNGATITSDVVTANGNWNTQNLITVFGDNVTINNVNIKCKQEVNKAIEVLGNNFTLENSVLLPADDADKNSGSIYLSFGDGDKTATLKNVQLTSWISNTTFTEGDTLNLENVTVDFSTVEEAADSDYLPIRSQGTVNASSFVVKVGSSVANFEQLIAGLPDNSTVMLEGDIEVDDTLNIQNKKNLMITGNSHTITASESFDKDTYGQTNLIKPENCDNFVLRDLRVIGTEKTKNVLDVYGCDSVTLVDVTLDHSASESGSPLNINGSNVTVASGSLSIITGPNSWHAIDVGKGDAVGKTPSFKVSEEGYGFLSLHGDDSHFDIVDSSGDSGTVIDLGSKGYVDENGVYGLAVAHIGDKTYNSLQNAIDAAGDGDVITLASGEYRLDSDQGIVVNKRVTIQGAADGTSIVTGSAVADYSDGLFNITSGGEGSVLKDFTIRYTSSGAQRAAVVFDYGFTGGSEDEMTRFENVHFVGTGSPSDEKAIAISSFYTSGGFVEISGCTIENFAYGIYFNGIHDLTIADNTINGTKYNAINIAADDARYPCTNVRIEGNTLENISSAGFDNDTYSSGINIGGNASSIVIEDNSISMLNNKKPIIVAEDDDDSTALVTYKVDGADYAVIIAEVDDSKAVLNVPNDPVKQGYIFSGWDYGNAIVTESNGVVTISIPDTGLPDEGYTFNAKFAKKPSVTPPAQTGDAVSVDQAEGGKVSVTPSRADEGDEVTITVTPDEGKEVASVTVTDEDCNKVDVKPGEKAGTWTFEMPDGKVTVSATFRCDGGELCPTHHLSDVEVGAWYHDGADWAVSTGLMAGMADGTFAPSTKLSRAQLAVVLWNRAGNPEASDPDAAAAFVDVDPDGFYAGALAWCVETGAFMGLDDAHFDPAGDMTREQLAVVLWRVAGEPESDRDLSTYPDGDTVSAFADTAMRWAVENGVISGQGDGTLDPQGAIDRAQAAVIFQRLAE